MTGPWGSAVAHRELFPIVYDDLYNTEQNLTARMGVCVHIELSHSVVQQKMITTL